MGDNDSIHLSIVTVVKNDPQGFLITGNSLLAQKSRKFNWLIVDGSSDNEIQSSVNQKFNSRLNLKYIKQEPEGIYAAMNAGWKNSTGTHIWFLNAGDFLTSSNSIDHLLANTSAMNSLIVFPTIHINSNNLIYDFTLPKITTLKNGQLVAEINHQGVVCSKQLLEKFGGFKNILEYAEDGRFLDYAVKNAALLELNRPLVAFSFGGASTVNFRQVLSEIDTYRYKMKKLHKLLLLIKTKVRIFLFTKKLGGFVDYFTRDYYSKKIKKTIEKKRIDLTAMDLLFISAKKY
jgi:glycosyltransferase involved in cell wall biosynthesis